MPVNTAILMTINSEQIIKIFNANFANGRMTRIKSNIRPIRAIRVKSVLRRLHENECHIELSDHHGLSHSLLLIFLF